MTIAGESMKRCVRFLETRDKVEEIWRQKHPYCIICDIRSAGHIPEADLPRAEWNKKYGNQKFEHIATVTFEGIGLSEEYVFSSWREVETEMERQIKGES